MPKATPRTFLISLYLSAVALIFVPASPLVAAEEIENVDTPVLEDCSVPTVTPDFASGMRVWIDPETGKIRQPTEAERKANAERTSIDALLNRSSEGLEVVVKPDGARFVHLQGRFMHALILTRAEDGTLVFECTDRETHDTDNEKTAANGPTER